MMQLVRLLAFLEVVERAEPDRLLGRLPSGVRGEQDDLGLGGVGLDRAEHVEPRSEEHTSELQSPCNLVCRLLLEKKNNSLKTARRDLRWIAGPLVSPPASHSARSFASPTVLHARCCLSCFPTAILPVSVASRQNH